MLIKLFVKNDEVENNKTTYISIIGKSAYIRVFFDQVRDIPEGAK